MATIPAALILQGWCPWCGDHMGWGMGWFWIFWIVLLLLVLAVVWSFARRPGAAHGEDRAEAALRERYARGEIDEETYHRMLRELRGG